jgi:hypothetical protein
MLKLNKKFIRINSISKWINFAITKLNWYIITRKLINKINFRKGYLKSLTMYNSI